ncbi:hypothetical protein D4M43_26110, partial [Escherichia coli]
VLQVDHSDSSNGESHQKIPIPILAHRYRDDILAVPPYFRLLGSFIESYSRMPAKKGFNLAFTIPSSLDDSGFFLFSDQRIYLIILIIVAV